MEQISHPPLIRYVVAVLIVWAIVLCLAWLIGGIARFKIVAVFCAGFLFGMLAMYIAVHIYAWR
jgi:hypothetical protein